MNLFCKTPKPEEFIEEERCSWKAMELKRMQRVILEKKGLRADVLERQRAPILKMRQEAKRKKRKIREIMQLQDKIFEDTMALLFPEQYYYDPKTAVLPRLSKYQEGEETASVKALLDDRPMVMLFKSLFHAFLHLAIWKCWPLNRILKIYLLEGDLMLWNRHVDIATTHNSTTKYSSNNFTRKHHGSWYRPYYSTVLELHQKSLQLCEKKLYRNNAPET